MPFAMPSAARLGVSSRKATSSANAEIHPQLAKEKNVPNSAPAPQALVLSIPSPSVRPSAPVTREQGMFMRPMLKVTQNITQRVWAVLTRDVSKIEFPEFEVVNAIWVCHLARFPELALQRVQQHGLPTIGNDPLRAR